MLEILAAMALLGILIAAFGTTINSVNKANRTFVAESRAVIVMENVLERLKSKTKISFQDVIDALDREFKKSGLHKDGHYNCRVREKDKRIIATISRSKDGRIMAEVKL
jgi:type II secretory pathway pseudopilin PulG